jgi:epoxyqueuosine reductase
MSYLLKPTIKKLFKQEASVFSFQHQNNALQKDLQAFDHWLQVGAHAQMEFLEKNLEVRKNPELILKEVKTAIIFLFPYAYGNKVRTRLTSELNAESLLDKEFTIKSQTDSIHGDSLIGKKLISKYVYGKDYHKTLKAQLNSYAENLKGFLKEDFQYRPVVDSIPFFDRAHAREAMLGFIGKNTLLIRPGIGSFFFIATLLTSLPIETLAEKTNKKNALTDLDCGSCTKCIDACPTQALSKDFFLDANKCLSYLSIEHRELIDPKYIPHFKDTLYGCDICQDVCPYNFVTLNSYLIPEFEQYHKPFTIITATQIATMTQEQYQQWFGGTAATRAKYEGLVRNALYHLYAIDHPEIKAICLDALNSTSDLINQTAKQILVAML